MVATTDTLLYANNASSTLNSDVGSGDVSIVLSTGQGAEFPSPAAGQYFVITLQNLQSGAFEVCYCTARSGDLLTVERAREGTTAQAFTAAQSIVQMRLTKGILEKLLQVRFTGADVDKYLKVQASGLVIPDIPVFSLPAGISYLDSNEAHTAGKATTPIAVSANGGGTVTLDLAESNTFDVTLGSNITLDFSNPLSGQTVNILLIQDATGGRTVTWATNKWTWPGGLVPVLSTAANAVDMLSGRYHAGATRMRATLLKALS